MRTYASIVYVTVKDLGQGVDQLLQLGADSGGMTGIWTGDGPHLGMSGISF